MSSNHICMSLSRFNTLRDQNLSDCKCTTAKHTSHQLYSTPITQAPCLINSLIIILIYPYRNGIQIKFKYILFISISPINIFKVSFFTSKFSNQFLSYHSFPLLLNLGTSVSHSNLIFLCTCSISTHFAFTKDNISFLCLFCRSVSIL